MREILTLPQERQRGCIWVFSSHWYLLVSRRSVWRCVPRGGTQYTVCHQEIQKPLTRNRSACTSGTYIASSPLPSNKLTSPSQEAEAMRFTNPYICPLLGVSNFSLIILFLICPQESLRETIRTSSACSWCRHRFISTSAIPRMYSILLDPLIPHAVYSSWIRSSGWILSIKSDLVSFGCIVSTCDSLNSRLLFAFFEIALLSACNYPSRSEAGEYSLWWSWRCQNHWLWSLCKSPSQ